MDKIKSWIDKEILTHTDLNAEFSNITDDADLSDAVTKKHTQGTDTDLDATFEATFVKKADNINVLSDITSTGANIEDAVTKKHTATLIGTKTIDETDIGNTKVIAYNSTSGNLEYENAGTPDAHATSHENSGGDEISVIGLSGLLADDQHVLNSEVLAIAAAKGANADITSMTTLTQITRATGGALDIAIGGAAGDDFTVDTDKLVVEGDTGKVGVGTITPNALVHLYNSDARLRIQDNADGYFEIDDIASTNVAMNKYNTTAATAYMQFNILPVDGQAARFRVFRSTNTSGAKTIQFFKGDNTSTIHGQIGVDGQNSYFQKGGGNFGIGTETPGGKCCINGGLTVGSDTDAGDNNLRIEGSAGIFGQLDMNTHKIVGVIDPTADQEAATKKYVDDNSGSGLSWSIISANTSAATGCGYFINASGGNITLTLPASPSIGNMVGVCDFYNKATTNTITIARNTKKIEGIAENLIININGAGFTIVYSDTTRGWEIVTEI